MSVLSILSDWTPCGQHFNQFQRIPIGLLDRTQKISGSIRQVTYGRHEKSEPFGLLVTAVYNQFQTTGSLIHELTTHQIKELSVCFPLRNLHCQVFL